MNKLISKLRIAWILTLAWIETWINRKVEQHTLLKIISQWRIVQCTRAIAIRFIVILVLVMYLSMLLSGYITPMVSGWLGGFSFIAPFIPASVVALIFWLLWYKFNLKKYAGGS